jgi:hypothetical protein
MNNEIDFLRASDGTGEAVRAVVQATRSIAATTLEVDSVNNWPDKFVATVGTLNPTTGIIDLATTTVFKGHLSGGDIIIDEIAPGYSDQGNSIGQVVVVKPATFWADTWADIIEVSHNQDGTLKDDSVHEDAYQDDSIGTSKYKNASVTADKINFTTGIWWEELGRTTLGSAGDVITVSSLPARKYLKLLIFASATGGTITGNLSFNNDTGNNYARRASTNSADSNSTGNSVLLTMQTAVAANVLLAEVNISNASALEKFITGVATYGVSGATAPTQTIVGGKWINTAAQINRIDIVNAGTGDFAIGSEVVVLGKN